MFVPYNVTPPSDLSVLPCNNSLETMPRCSHHLSRSNNGRQGHMMMSPGRIFATTQFSQLLQLPTTGRQGFCGLGSGGITAATHRGKTEELTYQVQIKCRH